MKIESFDGMTRTQTLVYRTATNWLPAGMLAITLILIASCSEESLQNSAILESIFSLVSHVVPGAHAFPALSRFPTYTAVAISLNWLFVPFLVGMTLYARRPTNGILREKIVQQSRKRGIFVRRVMFPACWMLLLAMDLGLVPGFGYFSGHGVRFAMEYSILKTVDQHPLGIAVFYWMLCVGESFVYGFSIFFVWMAALSIRRKAVHAI